MKDYKAIKSRIRTIPLSKASELDELLIDSVLMADIDRICSKNNADLPTYIQFLMEQNAPGDPRLPDLARMVVAQAKKVRPWIFED